MSKRQSLSTTTLLFRTTFTRTIKLNLLKLGNVKVEVLNNTLSNTPTEEKAEIIGDTMGDVRARPLVETHNNTLPPSKADTNLHTLGDVRAEAVVDTMVETLQDTSRHIKPFNSRVIDGHVGRHSSRAGS